MESLKILITGVSGFIGSNISRHLINKNHEVYGLMRNSEINWRLKDIQDQMVFKTANVLSYDDLHTIVKEIRPDGIIHCAQYGAYPQENNTREIYDVNLGGLFNILEVSSEFNINWLINSGTSFEYSGSGDKIEENAQSNPRSYYGIYKSACTNLLTMYSKMQETKFLTLRIFQAFGPYESKGRLAPYVIYNLINNRNIQLNNPYLERDFTYIRDISDAFEKSIQTIDSIEKHEIFNIGSGTSTSIQDFVSAGKNIINSSSKIVFGSFAQKPEDMINRLVADNSKANKILKWTPKYNVGKGIEDYFSWMRDRLDFYKT